ncbi:polysaccharide pyruvyl transferase family protein [Sedimentibacter sp. B4]|uniref:polysaccharide pyruvyl transferase family protein n=1 Tax=Sedimentibacter sp. B4 TaxID=304766 RepID=UPI0002D8433B|nr:polysaccharide pyruvyl transferase family protein [Sedimentibacter sp. B4]
MKVITLTTHSAHNHGAILQAYALQKFLKLNSCEAKILDYRPEYLIKPIINFDKNSNFTKQLIINIIAFRSRLSRKQKFESFTNKYLDLEQAEYDINGELVEIDADAYIVGSDQIWNQDITRGIDANFFLRFVKKSKKISYAASFGKDSISEEFKCISDFLESFDHLSVREESGKKILNELGYHNVHVTLDPVFLLDINEYNGILAAPKFENYILIYTLENNEEVNTLAKKIAKDKRMNIVSIGSYRNQYNSDIHIRDTGPEEFLGLIRNSSYVITNSFHAIAFSIIFNKQFSYVRLRNNRGTRIENLLRLISLEGKIELDRFSEVNQIVDYDMVNHKIDICKREAQEYLMGSIFNK